VKRNLRDDKVIKVDMLRIYISYLILLFITNINLFEVNIMRMSFKVISIFILFIAVMLPPSSYSAEFEDWSSDISHPFFSAWKPGYTLKLYGTNPSTGQTATVQYSVEGTKILGEINCVSVHYISSLGSDYYFYIAMDTDMNIRLLEDNGTSFLSNPPIFFPENASEGDSWTITYFSWSHRMSIDYTDTYTKNGSGYGPYEDSLYVRHYYTGALLGTICVADRFGYVSYDGRDVFLISEAALGVIEGTVTDEWNGTPIEGAKVKLEGGSPRETTTDSEGKYNFIDLPSKNFTLKVEKDLYELYEKSVTVPLGSTITRDAAVTPENGSVFGKVTDTATGLFMVNATVQVDQNAVTEVKTDSNGLYRIDYIRVGNHDVRAFAEFYGTDSKNVDVTVDSETELNFSIDPSDGSIKGTARNSLTRAPIEGVSVQLDNNEQSKVVTGSDGKFLLDNVTPEKHIIKMWHEDYLYYQKTITVGAEEEVNLGDILLVPKSTLMPAESDFFFDDGPDGWVFTSTESGFDEAEKSSEGGHLGLSPNGKNNCFGYWESPFIAFDTGKTYRAIFTVKSDQSSPEKVPAVRFRINSGNNQTIVTLSVNSLGEGDSSPITQPGTYSVVFSPPISSTSYGFTISFDIVNIGNDDNANAWIYLEEVQIEAVAVTKE
jgi:carboxypeptidase family protein